MADELSAVAARQASITSLCVCVCVYTYMCVCVCMYMNMCVHVPAWEPREQIKAVSYSCPGLDTQQLSQSVSQSGRQLAKLSCCLPNTLSTPPPALLNPHPTVAHIICPGWTGVKSAWISVSLISARLDDISFIKWRCSAPSLPFFPFPFLSSPLLFCLPLPSPISAQSLSN